MDILLDTHTMLWFIWFHLLPIDFIHGTGVESLPMHHRDPFDRLLISQALTERIPIVSKDAILESYGVTRLW